MVIYERKMEITFTAEKDGGILSKANDDRKVQSELHDNGMHLIPSYFWTRDIKSLPLSSKYGYNKRVDETDEYVITIDGKEAFSVAYSSRAAEFVNSMNDNGFNADFETIKTTKTKSEWRPVRGKYFVFTCDIDGKSTTSGLYPHVRYNDGTELFVKFAMTDFDAVLTFTITHEIEKLKNRKKIEESIVNVPASDMKLIRSVIQQALNRVNPHGEIVSIVDCSTKILSEANYECSPETVEIVMGE